MIELSGKSWKQVHVPTKARKRWQRAINQQILLNRMERENCLLKSESPTTTTPHPTPHTPPPPPHPHHHHHHHHTPPHTHHHQRSLTDVYYAMVEEGNLKLKLYFASALSESQDSHNTWTSLLQEKEPPHSDVINALLVGR